MSSSASKSRLLTSLGYICFLGIAGILSFELLSRLVLKDVVDSVMSNERNRTYQFDEVLGWLPEKNSHKKYTGSREILVHHNSRGFRDGERSAFKTKPRIVFLGDSFVWGYDVQNDDRFTEKLQKKLNGMEVVNLGVSGYSTDQEFLLLERECSYFHPDVVFLIFCGNDRRDNSRNSAYGYYKPYFVKENGRLKLKGVPVPMSHLYLLKTKLSFLENSLFFRLCLLLDQRFKRFTTNRITVPDLSGELIKQMNEFTEARGAKFAVGFTDHAEELMRHCEKESILFLDLSGVGASFRFLTHGNHWTEEGHTRVSELIYEFLRAKNWV